MNVPGLKRPRKFCHRPIYYDERRERLREAGVRPGGGVRISFASHVADKGHRRWSGFASRLSPVVIVALIAALLWLAYWVLYIL